MQNISLSMTNSEIWRDIKGYEGLYQVSNLGRVKSIERYISAHNGKTDYSYIHKEKILKNGMTTVGYYHVSLCDGNSVKYHSVHRLVAFAFPEICGEYVTVQLGFH